MLTIVGCRGRYRGARWSAGAVVVSALLIAFPTSAQRSGGFRAQAETHGSSGLQLRQSRLTRRTRAPWSRAISLHAAQATLRQASVVLRRDLRAGESLAIVRAHLIGKGEVGDDGGQARVGHYTWKQKLRKARVVARTVKSKAERRKLFEWGVLGEKSDSSVSPYYSQQSSFDRVRQGNYTLADLYHASRGKWERSDLHNPESRHFNMSDNPKRMRVVTNFAPGTAPPIATAPNAKLPNFIVGEKFYVPLREWSAAELSQVKIQMGQREVGPGFVQQFGEWTPSQLLGINTFVSAR